MVKKSTWTPLVDLSRATVMHTAFYASKLAVILAPRNHRKFVL